MSINDGVAYVPIPSTRCAYMSALELPTNAACSVPPSHLSHGQTNARLIAFTTTTKDPLLPHVWGEPKRGEDPYAPPDQGCCLSTRSTKYC